MRISPLPATLGAAVLILAAIAWALGSESRSNAPGVSSVSSADGLRYSTIVPSEKGVLAPCAVCHRIDANGPESSGPSLWGIDGAAKASSPWFGYSPALAAANGNWSATDIDAYLADPVGFLPGTSKTLSQVRDADERKRIIDALQALK